MLSSPAFPGCGYQRPQDLLEAACSGVPEWTDEPEWALDCICSSPTARPSPVGTLLDPCRQRSCLRQVTLTVCPRRFVSMSSESTVPSCRFRKPIRTDAVPKRSLNRSLGYGWKSKTRTKIYLAIMHRLLGPVVIHLEQTRCAPRQISLRCFLPPRRWKGLCSPTSRVGMSSSALFSGKCRSRDTRKRVEPGIWQRDPCSPHSF